jgi:ATP-dependent RNA helicase DDX24/MAK5
MGQLKAELRGLLKQPLVARGVSTRYITSGSHPIAHDMLAGECRWFHIPTAPCLSDSQTDHEGMIGVRRTEAGTDIAPRKGRMMEKENKKHVVEYEEWTGIS